MKCGKEKEKLKQKTRKKKGLKSPTTLWVMRVLLGDCAVYAQGTDAAIT